MKRKIGLSILALVFFAQLFVVLRTHYVQSNPAEVPSLSQLSNQEEQSESGDNVNEVQDSSEVDLDDVIEETNLPDDIDDYEIAESSIMFEFTPNAFSSFLSINPDFTGWLSIENTAIDYPVVRGRDNEFYLEHDFFREAHPLGAIFMDFRNIGNGQDNHTIIYGHHTSTGHMFADLEKFLSEDFFNENRTIVFEDIFSERTYEIFSVHVAPADAYFINESFTNPDMTDYLNDINERSVHQTDTEFTDDTRLLTLISCNYTIDDGRIYVHAVEVTE